MLFDADLEQKEVLKFVVGDTVAERLVHNTPGPEVWVWDLARSLCCVSWVKHFTLTVKNGYK